MAAWPLKINKIKIGGHRKCKPVARRYVNRLARRNHHIAVTTAGKMLTVSKLSIKHKMTTSSTSSQSRIPPCHLWIPGMSLSWTCRTWIVCLRHHIEACHFGAKIDTTMFSCLFWSLINDGLEGHLSYHVMCQASITSWFFKHANIGCTSSLISFSSHHINSVSIRIYLYGMALDFHDIEPSMLQYFTFISHRHPTSYTCLLKSFFHLTLKHLCFNSILVMASKKGMITNDGLLLVAYLPSRHLYVSDRHEDFTYTKVMNQQPKHLLLSSIFILFYFPSQCSAMFVVFNLFFILLYSFNNEMVGNASSLFVAHLPNCDLHIFNLGEDWCRST